MHRQLVRSCAAAALLVTTGLALMPSAASAASDPVVSIGSGHETDPGTPVALTGVSVDDAAGLATLRVRLEVKDGAGALTVTEISGLSFDVGDGDADPTIELRGTPADVNAALATLLFAPAPEFRGNAQVAVSVTDGTLLYEDHFYEYVDDPGITWDDARAAAAARSYYGRQGYLATITTAEENAFAAAKLGGEGWIGARAEIIADRQHWRWVTGPEAERPDAEGAGPLRGLPFYFGSDMTQWCTVQPDQAPVGGRYSNWLVNEPNNCEDELVAHFVLPSGTWNDYAPDNGNIDGYVVEYGGLADDDPIALPSVTATIVVRTGVAPLADDPTTIPSTTQAPAAPSTTATATGDVPAGSTGAPSGAAPGRAGQQLAFTGAHEGPMAVAGGALVAAGAALLAARRRRPSA